MKPRCTKAQVVHQVRLVADHQSLEVTQPSEQMLDPPTPFVPSPLATVLGGWFAPIPSMRGNQLAASCGQACIKSVTIGGEVANQFLGLSRGKACLHGHLMRASTRDPHGDRKTSAVCHCHELPPLAPLGSDSRSKNPRHIPDGAHARGSMSSASFPACGRGLESLRYEGIYDEGMTVSASTFRYRLPSCSRTVPLASTFFPI